MKLSVTNKLPIKTEHEKMSNLRNLFCMVALNIFFQEKHEVGKSVGKSWKLETFKSDSSSRSWTIFDNLILH